MSTLITISKFLLILILFIGYDDPNKYQEKVKFKVFRISSPIVVQVDNWEQYTDLQVIAGISKSPLKKVDANTFIGLASCEEDSLHLYFLSNLTIFDSAIIICPEECKITARIEGYYPLNKIPHFDDDSLSYYNPCKSSFEGRITSFTLQLYKGNRCIYNKFREENRITSYEKNLIKDSLNNKDFILLRDMVIDYTDTTISNDTLTNLSLYFPQFGRPNN